MGLVWCVLGVESTCKGTDVGGLLWGQTNGGAWQNSPGEGMEPGGWRLPAESGGHRARHRHRQAAPQPAVPSSQAQPGLGLTAFLGKYFK